MLLDLSELHGSDVERLKDELLHANKAVSDQFDRVFAILDGASESIPTPPEATKKTLKPLLRVLPLPSKDH